MTVDPALEASAELVRRALPTRREITAADAAARAGVPLAEAEPALLLLASRHPSRLRVTEDGHLLFAFRSLRDPERPFARALRYVTAVARPVGGVLASVVTLALLPLLFFSGAGHTLVALDVLLAAFGPLSDGATVALTLPLGLLALGLAFGGILALAAFVAPFCFLMATVGGLFVVGLEILRWRESSVGNGLSRELVVGLIVAICTGTLLPDHVRKLAAAESPALLWRLVRGLVFGPPRPPRATPEDQRRRLAAWIRFRGGVIGLQDVVIAFGCDLAEAERRLVGALVDFEGDLEVTSEGALVGRFEALVATRGDETAPPAPAHEAPAAAPRFFGIGPWLAGFSLLWMVGATAALAAHPQMMLFPTLAHYRSLDELWPIAQGLGALVYLVPLGLVALRLPFWLTLRLRAARRGRLLALIRIVAEPPESAWVSRVSARDLARLEGDVAEADAAGRFRLTFPTLALAAAEAERVRRERPVAASIGEVVFDSERPETDSHAA